VRDVTECDIEAWNLLKVCLHLRHLANILMFLDSDQPHRLASIVLAKFPWYSDDLFAVSNKFSEVTPN
jgi:hypothetical protein